MRIRKIMNKKQKNKKIIPNRTTIMATTKAQKKELST